MAEDDGPVYFEHVEALIKCALMPRGVANPRVLDAFRRVPREAFMPSEEAHRAYDNMALDIGFGQTISQPLMIGLMLQDLDIQPFHRVLEIGAGSGYQAALLSHMADEVISVERIPNLADRARVRLRNLGFENVTVVVADGSVGWPDNAPYDRIIVACAAPRVPEPLKQQLADCGKLLVPVGSRKLQRTLLVTRTGDEFSEIATEACVFVPLIGEEGWELEEGRE